MRSYIKIKDLPDEDKDKHRKEQLRKSRYQYYKTKKMLLDELYKTKQIIEELKINNAKMETEINNYKLLLTDKINIEN